MSWKESPKSKKLDYRLLAVHAAFDSDEAELQDEVSAFQNHILLAGREASQRFSRTTLELVSYKGRWSDFIDDSFLLKGMAKECSSLGGEITAVTDPSSFRGERVVLTGLYFGACHSTTFDALLRQSVGEVHIPLDCTTTADYCTLRSDIPSEPQFRYYVEALQRYGSYRLLVPDGKRPYVEVINGDQPVIVAFHRSWREMMGGFEERR